MGGVRMIPGRRFSISAAALLAGLGLAATVTPSVAQDKKPNIVVIMGDDIGWANIGAYHQGLMYSNDAEPRQAGRRGHALHRLLRGAELHRRPRQFHHRRIADPHRSDHGRPGRRHGRHAGRGADDRDGVEGDGIRHRPVRQEPSGRLEPLPADRAWVRRIFRLPLSPRRDGGPVLALLSAGAEGHGRATQLDPQLRHHVDDPTVQPRWGKIGKQKIEDEGPLPPHPMPGIKYNMETVDEDILDYSKKFIDKARRTASRSSCG